MSETGKVHEAICKVMKEMEAVGKTRKNTHQNYSYRGIADIYQALQLVMAENLLHVHPVMIRDRTYHEAAKGRHIEFITTYRITHADGSYCDGEAICEGADFGDKACNKAMSAGMKYWLIQSFLIPEEDPAIDTEHETGILPKKEPPATPPAPAGPVIVDHKASIDDAIKALLDAGAEKKALPKTLSDILGRSVAKSTDLVFADVVKINEHLKRIERQKLQASAGPREPGEEG